MRCESLETGANGEVQPAFALKIYEFPWRLWTGPRKKTRHEADYTKVG
jgi:hypothetical protein